MIFLATNTVQIYIKYVDLKKVIKKEPILHEPYFDSPIKIYKGKPWKKDYF